MVEKKKFTLALLNEAVDVIMNDRSKQYAIRPAVCKKCGGKYYMLYTNERNYVIRVEEDCEHDFTPGP